MNQWLKACGLLHLKKSGFNVSFVQIAPVPDPHETKDVESSLFLPGRVKNMKIPVIWRKKKGFLKRLTGQRKQGVCAFRRNKCQS